MIKKLVGGLILALALAGCGNPGTNHAHSPHAFAKVIGHLNIRHWRHHHLLGQRNYFGTVTNLGVDSMANDTAWAAPSGASICTLCLSKYMATGTGATAAAATDIALQTADAMTVATGTITPTLTPNAASEKVVGTINYTGTEAVTEWGLFNSSTLSATTGTPWTAGTATSGTVTGTPLTASSTTVQGQQQLVAVDTTISCYALVTSNTTSVVTVPAWYNTGATTTCTGGSDHPSNTDTAKFYALMLDHQVFSAINVINGDSIQFSFTLSLPSGS